ncbi:UNVERIFIED_CONTAM: hypothetical protein Slati_0763600 [Sesamum latifolium]|uniref:Myb/SANT-like domain-containing protein n=1 Tax=Sesamum latifolium TaxID=2727402 RepID=A0AAW2XM58_9LAMI
MDADFQSSGYVNNLEDDGSSRPKQRGSNKERSGPRRTWTIVEEEALINGLKSLITTGWKCDNGFRNGYLPQLEAHMKRAFLHSNIKADPHITSKLHVWKKQYSILMTTINPWFVSKAWEEFIKIEPSARGMRYKSWPFFPEWSNIFDKDRATGDRSWDPTQLVNIVSNFCETTNNRIGSLTRALESEFGDPEKRDLVMDAVREIPGLEENEILVVTSKLAHEPRDMNIFFKLGPESKEKMVRLILAGRL